MTDVAQTDFALDFSGDTIFARRWIPVEVDTTHATPLILIHDSLGCVELWRDFPAALVQHTGRPVIAYDRLGFGKSSALNTLPGPDFILDEANQMLPFVREKLRISEFAVLGHSVGGAMALLSAAQAKDLCEAAISESAQASIEERTIFGIRNARAQFDDPVQFARLKRWHGDKARWVLDAWTKIWTSDKYASWTITPYLPQVKCPVLAIHGDNDEYGSVRFPEEICKHVGGPARMEILEGVGHVPHREKPDVVLQLVTRFLDDAATLKAMKG